jgi:hypothetical protein
MTHTADSIASKKAIQTWQTFSQTSETIQAQRREFVR